LSLLALGSFYPLPTDSAIRAVFGTVGTRVKIAAAHSASLSAQLVKQGGFQLLVHGQHRRLEPPTQQGVGNALDADTAFPIVQQKAVAAIIITARMHQPPCFAVLLVIHSLHIGLLKKKLMLIFRAKYCVFRANGIYYKYQQERR